MTQMVVNFVRQPIVEQLDWTLLHFLWQATAVAFLVATVLRSIRTAAATWRYTTACLGLLLLAVTPVVTFFMVEGRADSNAVTNTPREINEGIVADADEALTSLLAQDGAVSATTGPGTDSVTGITLTNLPPDWSTAEDSNSDAEVLSQQNDRGRGSALPSVSESPDWQVRVRSSLPWVVACWVVGVLLLSLWHAAGWLFAKRLTVQGTCPVPVAVQSAFQELVERMQIRRRVQLLQSARARVPVVIGWLKPVLLMPAGVLSGLSGDQLQAILAHELAHVRRHDYLVNLLQTIVETFLFYHPAVWWLSRRIRIEREFCADDEAAGVCQDRESYARALLCLADAVAAVPATAVAASGGSLTERVYRLLGVTVQPHRVSRRSPWFASAGIAVAVFCGLVFSSPSPARQIDEKPPKPTPIQEVAEQLGGSIPGWNLLDFDREPSVAVAGFGGYRVVLRRKWKQYTNPPQQQAARAAPGEGGREPPFEWRTVDWEFVLIPNQPEPAPAALKSRMNWTKSRSPYHTRDLCLGDGFGYTWFIRKTCAKRSS